VSEQEGQVRFDVGGWISGPCLSRPLNRPHGMSGEEATSLFHLRCIWGDRYGISFTSKGWAAHRLGTGARWDIRAETGAELRGKIWADYREWEAEARRMR
jgi:hypothetical protein